MKPYYLVWNKTTCYTKYTHTSYQSAKEEAARLANAHPGSEFVVLCAVASIKRQDLIIDEVPNDQIPF